MGIWGYMTTRSRTWHKGRGVGKGSRQKMNLKLNLTPALIVLYNSFSMKDEIGDITVTLDEEM